MACHLSDCGLYVSSRSTAGGDFFDAATLPKGGDIYVLSRILHDWDDSKALHILRNIYEASMTTMADRPWPARYDHHMTATPARDSKGGTRDSLWPVLSSPPLLPSCCRCCHIRARC